ncbi:MAG: type I DNA topoisomerase [Bacteroidaceae bacterium]|nr:type I DNA topoisomerase [Bacteroidaceae bacterium]MCF0199281.1 type I DNA topoisomerase [Bacteroidaceae bacterium]
MKPNLVIVESPAKAKTIEKFLGDDYKVMSSYGHIRDLKKHSFSIDTETFQPQYEIPSDKQKLVGELKKLSKDAQMVWLASDEDREGEAISWHLKEVLGLDGAKTRRIVFHEITKPAILAAIENPRDIDTNLVNAQQARRVLDRIVGFKLSPLLWRKVRPGLSAGRVQSVAVRLIVEREREIMGYESESSYRVTATFLLPEGGELKVELNHKFATEEEAKAFLEQCRDAQFTIEDIQTKPSRRTPAPPFTTSTLQQEAAHKLGFTVSQTMMVAQRLYESGRITYMRTDSVNLSSLCLGTSKKYISETMGDTYVKTRQYTTNSKGAQEAHEAIRPTYMDQTEIEGTAQERKLYNLIWKRTIACQMADAELERTVATISVSGSDYNFVAQGEVVVFDGFLRVYRETEAEDGEPKSAEGELPPLQVGTQLSRKDVTATQRFSQRPLRYNEASLVRKLEELGIGRPSTYATTITTIQQREYVVKGDKPGEPTLYQVLTLKGDKLKQTEKKQVLGAERGKLLPTDTGCVVSDFLLETFPQVLDYNFTAEVEKDFDSISVGEKDWMGMMSTFYGEFNPLVEDALENKSEHRVGERVLGEDPATGQVVTVKIGRFGPVAQIGSQNDTRKPRFAQLKDSQSLETITLDEALELFRLPRTLGLFEQCEVSVGSGRFGPYVQHQRKYVSIPKDVDPLEITLEEAINLIMQKRMEETQRRLKTFAEEPELEVLNGRFGPYITYKGTNYRLAKTLHDKAAELTLEECMEIIKEQDAEGPRPTRGRRTAHKK